MGEKLPTVMRLSVALRLGRVSNLPTVWSNVLAGVALAGGSTWDPRVLPLLFAHSLFYTGGMFLNDAMDSELDAVERPTRPIPNNEVTAMAVYSLGGLMLMGGLLILVGIGYLMPTGTGYWPVIAGLILCSLIVLYDLYHKKNPFSPLIMGACRLMVYIIAAYAVLANPAVEVLLGGMVLLCWVIGLTYISKQEALDQIGNLWPLGFLAVPLLYCFPYLLEGGIGAAIWGGLLVLTVLSLYLIKRRKEGDISQAVATFIAGISLVDGLFIYKFADPTSVILALAAFPLTIALQRVVPGT